MNGLSFPGAAKRICFLLCMVSFTFVACRNKNKGDSLTIETETVLDSVPSGSALAIHNDTVYIIGDDATGVYTLNLEDYSYQKIAIPGFLYSEYREPKDTKRDFEAAGIIEWQNSKYLCAFGSGSKKNLRDSLLLFNLDDHNNQRIFSLSGFYSELQRQTATDPTHWNVEGATVVGGNLVVCNRGNNMIILVRLQEFLEYLLDNKSAFPQIAFHRVKLPVIENREARFSGICTLSDSLLLFCASVEDTPDWIQDGPVMGSYIGVYSILKNELVVSHLLKDKEGRILKEKIESIDVLNQEKGTINLLAIADNDNGSSKLFRLNLRWDEN